MGDVGCGCGILDGSLPAKFVTRLVDSAARVVFLIPCLLICLACATPFPFEKLEEGLTVGTVLREFGPPEAIESGSGDAGPCWCYPHEKQMWTNTIFFPITPFMIPFMKTWSDAYFTREEVVLHFEEEKLVLWDHRERTIWHVYSGTDTLGEFFDKQDPDYAFDPGLPSPYPYDTGGVTYRNPYEPACEWDRASAEGVVKIGGYLYVARDYVSFWMEPTASSENKVSVARGQRMTLLGKRCGWCHLEDEFGATGWISCVFLNAEAP